MSKAITIMEVSPRDGLQNESTLLSSEEKLQLIDFALASGSKRIEVASFVNPKVVPQMADAEAVCAGLPQRGDIRYTGLVLNQRGYDRLRATERIDEAGIVISASDIFGEKNQGMNLDRGVKMAQDILRQGRAAEFPVQVTIAVAFGCPFSGDVAAQDVINIVRELVDFEPCEIALADTIGVGVPNQVTDLFGALAELTAGEIPLRAHFHDTRNTGIANAQAAVLAGVTTLDASMGGIGGCPFAPNATGNIATEDLVYLLDRSGTAHDLDLQTLLTGAEWLQGVLGRVVPSALLKAGGFPAKLQA